MFGRKQSPTVEGIEARLRRIADPKTSAAEGSAEPVSKAHEAPTVAKPVRKLDRAGRKPIFRMATIITSGGAQQTVALKDVSKTGARIECYNRSPLPDLVVIVEPSLDLHKRARVVWQIEGRVGLAFLEE